MSKAVSYDEMRQTLNTGDLLLFEGKSTLSEILKHAQRSQFSHVGMVLRPPATDLVLCIESTTLSTVPDLLLGKGISGVQVVLLSERLATYEGDVWVRQLEHVPWTHERWTALERGRQELHGRPYEQNKLNLIRAWYDGPLAQESPRDLTSLFCSELIAELYQRCELLPAGPPSSEWIVADFAERRMVDEFLQAGKLSDPIRMRYTPQHGGPNG